MKFGVQLAVSPRYFREMAQIAESSGFETIFVPEHLAFPAQLQSVYPYSEDGLPHLTSDTPCYDPMAQLGFLAACTTTVRLATNVCIAPLRHPIVLARSLNTIDRLSGGRVTLGLGVGWLREEFEWIGERFSDRGRRADAIITALRRLWRDDVVEHHDEHYDFGPLICNPKPLQPGGVPIHVGGSSEAALRRAGRFGDGWLEIGARDLDEVLQKRKIVFDERRAAGRDDLPFEVTTKVGGADPDVARRARDEGITRISVLPRALDGGPLTVASFGEWAADFRSRFIERT